MSRSKHEWKKEQERIQEATEPTKRALRDLEMSLNAQLKALREIPPTEAPRDDFCLAEAREHLSEACTSIRKARQLLFDQTDGIPF